MRISSERKVLLFLFPCLGYYSERSFFHRFKFCWKFKSKDSISSNTKDLISIFRNFDITIKIGFVHSFEEPIVPIFYRGRIVINEYVERE